MEVFGSYLLQASLRDLLAESMYPADSRIIFVPLNEEQHTRWLKFLELACPRTHCSDFGFRSTLKCYESGEVLLELNHPFVPVVSDFAVDAFNELCRMYFKKGVEDNIYEADVTNVKHMPNCYGYTFFITLEALEEDVVGVYEATVICDYVDGRRTLLEFSRTLRPPVGACHMRDKFAHGINGKIKRTSPDDWFIPNKITGLQRRSAEHSCGGYDYHNPLKVFAGYMRELPIWRSPSSYHRILPDDSLCKRQ